MSNPADGKSGHRLLTGTDDDVFCYRFSEALQQE